MKKFLHNSKLQYLFKKWEYGVNIFISHFEHTIIGFSYFFEIVSGIASLACLIALTVYVGYNLNESDRRFVWVILRIAQSVFAASILYECVFRFRHTIRQGRIIKWIVDIGLILTLIAWAYPYPETPWLSFLRNILYSHRFLFIVLGSFALVNLCYTISKIPNRRTNPSLLMAISFLTFIILGSFALMLPRCTYHGISYFDSLFVSSSAVCITGLSSVDIPTTFTPFGILVISILVQLGSLGVITFTSFFAMFFTGNTSIYNQLLLKDMIYSKSMNSLIPTLLYVLGFTLVVELIGAVAVFFTIPETLNMTIDEKLMFSSFHSMSSFCNAGFSCLPQGMANPLLMNSNQNIYIVTSILIFAGAIGFPILVNIKEILSFYMKKLWNSIKGGTAMVKRVHIFDLNTKIVICTTLGVLLFGSVAFFIFEYNNTLQGMGLYKKVVQSVFNSLIPRSAGFASVNPSHFLNVTILIILVQMIIGGSSQSMAGGIKVNTLGAVLLNVRSVLYGHEGTSAFNRTINRLSIRRANAVIVISAIALLAYFIIMFILESHLPVKAVVFETISALFTVGSSLGITSELCDSSKVVLCTAMFFGRVGLLSLLCGICTRTRDLSTHLPTDNIIIN